MIPVKPHPLEAMYESYFNMGFGTHFHKFGVKCQRNYDYLMDFEMPITHLLNLPANYEIYYEDAYMGGSSMKINSKEITLWRVSTMKKSE